MSGTDDIWQYRGVPTCVTCRHPMLPAGPAPKRGHIWCICRFCGNTASFAIITKPRATK